MRLARRSRALLLGSNWPDHLRERAVRAAGSTPKNLTVIPLAACRVHDAVGHPAVRVMLGTCLIGRRVRGDRSPLIQLPAPPEDTRSRTQDVDPPHHPPCRRRRLQSPNSASEGVDATLNEHLGPAIAQHHAFFRPIDQRHRVQARDLHLNQQPTVRRGRHLGHRTISVKRLSGALHPEPVPAGRFYMYPDLRPEAGRRMGRRELRLVPLTRGGLAATVSDLLSSSEGVCPLSDPQTTTVEHMDGMELGSRVHRHEHMRLEGRTFVADDGVPVDP